MSDAPSTSQAEQPEATTTPVPPAAEPAPVADRGGAAASEPGPSGEGTPREDANGSAAATPSSEGDADARAATSAAFDAADATTDTEGQTADEATPVPEGASSAGDADEAPASVAVPATSQSVRARVRAEARSKAMTRFAAYLGRGAGERAAAVVEALESGKHPLYLGRYRRDTVGGLDERRMVDARAAWRGILGQEERRAELRELVSSRAALTEEIAGRLDGATDVVAMEDLAAPWLPVTASRATVARGQGLQPLADGIRGAKEATPSLSDLTKPFVKEGTEVATLDAALAGARDIVAEAFCLDVVLRARLRTLFRREAAITVSLRSERKGDAGRHRGLVGFSAPAGKVPPLKLAAIRRGERERVLTVSCEPPEEKALGVVHDACPAAFGAEHPHSGFLRAAAEDGYRRILKPMLAAEVRTDLRARADGILTDGFERTLKNLLLGPIGGPVRVLAIRPDVTAGHRVAALDERGRAVHAGRLPHEATAGREAAATALRELVEAHAVDAIAVGTGGGRKEARALVDEAAKSFTRPMTFAEVADGGARSLEAAAVDKPVTTESGVEIGPEFVGAMSIARRFQDPLGEYVRLDPRWLGLGLGVHDVHQGRLKERLDDVIEACVAHVGPDATVASAELLARVPGLDLGKARAFVAWRDAGGMLAGKSALGAVEGVGLDAAAQAVGFVRVSGTGDPRDRTQLHPEQYDLVDAMAAQVGCDVPELFREPRARAAVDFRPLVTAEKPLGAWKHALWQATAGMGDPRPRYATATPPPADLTVAALRPGLVLEGRVIRAVPFGVFVDVGLPADALIPTPFLGDRPGLDQAVVAPVGAIVQGRVVDVDVAKKRITLTMRVEERRPRFDDRRPSGRSEGPPRGDRGPRPDRGGRGPGRDAPAGVPPGEPMPVGVGPGSPLTGHGRGGGRTPRGDDRRGGGPARGRGGDRGAKAGAGGAARPDRRAGAPVGRTRRDDDRGGGGFRSGGGGGDQGRRFDRDDAGAPRRISLPSDTPTAEGAEVDEATLSPMELLAKKLELLKKKIARPE